MDESYINDNLIRFLKTNIYITIELSNNDKPKMVKDELKRSMMRNIHNIIINGIKDLDNTTKKYQDLKEKDLNPKKISKEYKINFLDIVAKVEGIFLAHHLITRKQAQDITNDFNKEINDVEFIKTTRAETFLFNTIKSISLSIWKLCEIYAFEIGIENATNEFNLLWKDIKAEPFNIQTIPTKVGAN